MKFPRLFGRKVEKRSTSETRDLSTEEIFDIVAQALSFGAVEQNSTSRSLSAVHRAVEIISDSIAILPIQIRRKGDYHTENIDNHPLHYVFNNMLMTKYTFMKMLIESVMMTGNGFAYIVRGKDGLPIELRYCNNGDVTINYVKEKQIVWYKVANISGKVEPKDMIHLVKNTNNGINGISILSFAKRAIKLANSTENAASNFFTNGCNLSGILKVQGTLSGKQREQIHQSWNQAYYNGGTGLAVLPGNMEYTPTSQNSAESQMLETRNFNVQDIARFFGISPILLGDTSGASYSTVEALQTDFLIHTLQPYIDMVEAEFNRKLLSKSDSNLVIKLNESYLLRTDKLAQAQYFSTLLDKGVLCINEVRKELGFSPVAGGDAHTIAYSDPSQNNIDKTQDTSEIEK